MTTTTTDDDLARQQARKETIDLAASGVEAVKNALFEQGHEPDAIVIGLQGEVLIQAVRLFGPDKAIHMLMHAITRVRTMQLTTRPVAGHA